MPSFTANDRFFDPLVSFLANHISVSLTLIARKKGAVGDLKGQHGGVAARAAGLVFSYEILSVLAAVEAGEWPNAIIYAEEPLPDSAKLPQPLVKGTNRVHQLSAQGMFVQYTDSVNERMRAAHKHPTVQFARLVRNAAAHGGRIQFDAKAPPVSWRSLTWSRADHGKQLLAGDIKNPVPALSHGDLIFLMRDLDAAI